MKKPKKKKLNKEKLLDELYNMYLQKMGKYLYSKYLPPLKIQKNAKDS